MKKALLLLLLVTVCQAAEDEKMTFGLRNGRFWRSVLLDENSRHACVLGFADAWELRTQIQDVVPGAILVALTGAGRFNTAELSAMVTSFYLQAENLELPIGWVVVACLAIQRGDLTTESASAALRKHLTALLSAHKPLTAGEIDFLRILSRAKSHPGP